jgi:hypothetical protein
MTTPKMNVAAKFTTFAKATAYVVGVTSKGDKPVLAETPIDVSSISPIDLQTLGVKSSLEATYRIAAPNGAIYLLIGLGKGN